MSDINEMNAGLKWYVAHTYAGYENKVKTNIENIVKNRGLQELIQDVRIPMEAVTEGEGEEAKTSEAKLLPSYVLIQMVMCDESWHVVRNIRGVTGFVGPGSKPVPLTDEEVDYLLGDAPTAEDTLAIGEMVTITGGIFAGYSGKLAEIAENGDVTIIVSAVGRDMPIKASIKEIKRLAE